MGRILLRNGQESKGLLWLTSALQLDPQHQPSLRLLADYYERVGQPGVAHRYRRQIAHSPK
jgi:Tfp pilus assembly protein PilF